MNQNLQICPQIKFLWSYSFFWAHKNLFKSCKVTNLWRPLFASTLLRSPTLPCNSVVYTEYIHSSHRASTVHLPPKENRACLPAWLILLIKLIMPETELLLLDSIFSVNPTLKTVCHAKQLVSWSASGLSSIQASFCNCSLCLVLDDAEVQHENQTKQNVSPVLSIALPKASREVRENNTSWSCWELKTAAE